MADERSSNVDVFGNRSGAYPRIGGGIKYTGSSVMAFSTHVNENNYTIPEAGDVGDAQQEQLQYAGMVVQNYQLTYAQNIIKLRGLNRNEVWSVVSPPTGQFMMQVGIVGEQGFYRFLNKYGDACNTHTNTIHLKDGSQVCRHNITGNDIGAMPDLTLQGCLCSQIQLTQSVDNLVMMSNTMLEFVALDGKGQRHFANRYMDRSAGGSSIAGIGNAGAMGPQRPTLPGM